MWNPQTERRANPYPFSWEIPAGWTAIWLLLASLTVHVGRAIANLNAGAGWRWPSSTDLFSSLPKILTGHATAGLQPAPPTSASPAALLSWIVVTELVVLALSIIAAVHLWRRIGGARMLGMAAAGDVQHTLGVGRLRKAKRIIRPDLYAPTICRGGHDGYHPTC